MQPENNMQSGVAPTPSAAPSTASVTTPVATPETPKSDNLFENTPKKSNGMLIGLILCIFLAIGGIGFGVWMMMDGNTQKEQLNSQIATLRGQVSELQEKLENTTTDDCALVDDESEDEKEEVKRGWPVTGGVFGSTFYVIDNADKVVAKDEDLRVLSLKTCDIPVAEDMSKPSSLTCSVTVGDGDGVFFYDGIDGSLEFYYFNEWQEKWQDIVNRHN